MYSDVSKYPLVSIAALCYNHERFLTETLDSIKNQTYPNIEVIVMDDCSQDNSVEIIYKWLQQNSCKWRFISHAENQGLCKSANEALSLTNGEYFQIIACDDILYQDKIERQINLFNKFPEEVSVLCADVEFIDAEGRTVGDHEYRFNEDNISYHDLLKECVIMAPSVLIKKGVFDIVGNYDERLYFEDWDLWLRISKEFKIKKENRVNVKYRQLDSSMYGQRRNKWSLETSYLIMEKQLPATKEHRRIINQHFIKHIEHLYVNKKRLYWLKKIMSNKFSIGPIIHFVSASIGLNYRHGKSLVKFGGSIKKRAPGRAE